MTGVTRSTPKTMKCAIYTRKSSEEGLDQEFNSLHAQREACESYIHSQRHEGWQLHPDLYDDGGYSGGNIERPALTRLLQDLKSGLVNIIVVYKIDRLSRSLSDFVRMIEIFDKHNASFVSVTQQFNTSTSMGRLTLNVLLSFAQFEREVTGERIRDKIAASARKGMWTGGPVPLGFDVIDKKLVVNATEAHTIQHIYNRYLALGCVRKLKADLDLENYVSKKRVTRSGETGGVAFGRGALYTLLKNPLYIGKIRHHDKVYDGQHLGIVEPDTWNQVQQQLEANRQLRRCRVRASEPSLLANLIYDDKGNRMSPSHGTRNKNRRYRYYVSQATLKYKDKQAGSVSRISAQAIESLVIQELQDILGNGTQLMDLNRTLDLAPSQTEVMIETGRRIVNEWDKQFPQQQLEILTKAVKRVTVGKNRVTLVLSKTGLSDLLEIQHKPSCDTDEVSDEITIDREVRYQRYGIESKLIIEGQSPGAAHPRTIKAIQQALDNALRWNKHLVDGETASMKELATRHDVTQRYVAHLIKLAWLSPDIIKAIKQGRVPVTLSLDRLKKGFPLDWDQQWKTLNFDSLTNT